MRFYRQNRKNFPKVRYKGTFFQWINDFSAARNFSISQATYDWILVLDCDEFVEFANREQFMEFENAPDNPYLHFQIGQEYYNQCQWELAIPHLEQVLAQELISEMEYHRLSVMAYGDCLMHLGRLEEA